MHMNFSSDIQQPNNSTMVVKEKYKKKKKTLSLTDKERHQFARERYYDLHHGIKQTITHYIHDYNNDTPPPSTPTASIYHHLHNSQQRTQTSDHHRSLLLWLMLVAFGMMSLYCPNCYWKLFVLLVARCDSALSESYKPYVNNNLGCYIQWKLL